MFMTVYFSLLSVADKYISINLVFVASRLKMPRSVGRRKK